MALEVKTRELAGDQPEHWQVAVRTAVRGPWYAVRTAVLHAMLEVSPAPCPS